MADTKFWGQDVTTAQDHSWFGALSPKRKLVYGMLTLFIISWCFFLGFWGGFAWGAPDEDEIFLIDGTALNAEEEAYEQLQLTGVRTILIVGCDTREGDWTPRSDTIMLAFLNLSNKTVDLLSIPRDTYVQIPGVGKAKINHAFASGGVSVAKETVEYLLGIKIDDYMVVEFQGFKDVVDAVGGVEINVEQDMYNWNESINIKAGLQVLNGHDSLGYVRYRGDGVSDYDRIGHQQEFLLALANKVLSFSSIPHIAELVGIAMNNVETSVSALDALDLAKYATKMDLANMGTYTVQGYSKWIKTGEDWLIYELVDKSKLTAILNEIAGDGFVFSPNVIDDGGLGYYSIPAEEEVGPEVDGQLPEGGTVDPEGNDPAAGEQPAEGGGENGETGEEQASSTTTDNGIDPWSVPEPGQ